MYMRLRNHSKQGPVLPGKLFSNEIKVLKKKRRMSTLSQKIVVCCIGSGPLCQKMNRIKTMEKVDRRDGEVRALLK